MKAICRLTLAAAALLIGTAVYAQELRVTKFELDAKDKTACRKATAKKDADGKKCAVIKLVDGQETLYKSEGARAVATQPALIYVSAKEKSVKIDNAELGSVDFVFPFPLAAGKTYVMQLQSIPAPVVDEVVEEPAPIVVPEQQFVLFTVAPEQAIIELGSETVVARGGEAQKLLNVGHYSYKVSAKGYYPEEGEFDLADSAKVEIEISLREANGWISIVDKDEDITGAAVYIDDEFVGNAPLIYGKLINGPHKLMLAKDQYSNSIGTVEVKDNDTLVVSPCLQPNFSVVTLTTAENAEIWANGEKKGVGTWTGKLLAGAYNFEARELGYTSQVVTEEVVVDPAGLEFTIPDPLPIYGNILVMSYPAKACVFVDSEAVGQTPLYLPKVMYGKHKIEILKKGFKPYCEEADMNESKRIVVNTDLEAIPEECLECAEKCCDLAEAQPAEECCKPAEEKPAECCDKPADEVPAEEVAPAE